MGDSQDSTPCAPCVPSPWLKLSQARAYLQMDNNELRRLVKSGEIRSVVRGRTTFVRATWLDAYMESLPSGAAQIAMAAKSQ